MTLKAENAYRFENKLKARTELKSSYVEKPSHSQPNNIQYLQNDDVTISSLSKYHSIQRNSVPQDAQTRYNFKVKRSLISNNRRYSTLMLSF